MSKNMLGEVLRQVGGPLGDLWQKLAGEDGQEWLEALKRFLRKEESWPQVVKQVLLKLVTTVILPAIATFRALDHFKVGEVEGVKVGFVSDNFKRVFLTGDGKVERKVAKATLRVHQLLKGLVDSSIIAELGGEEVAETTLAQMWKMMKRQGRGQKGKLLTNSYANIFYIRDTDGVLWAVDCGWDSSCAAWGVGAGPVRDPGAWADGSQVVSR